MDQLVVLLHRCDRIGEFLPYIEALLRPGMTISFLIHYGSVEFPMLMDQLLVVPSQAFSERGGAGTGDGSARGFEHQSPSETALSALRRPGIELKVRVYSGSASKALQEFAREYEVESMLFMRRGSRCVIRRAARRMRWLAHLLNRQIRSPSVILLQSP